MNTNANSKVVLAAVTVGAVFLVVGFTLILPAVQSTADAQTGESRQSTSSIWSTLRLLGDVSYDGVIQTAELDRDDETGPESAEEEAGSDATGRDSEHAADTRESDAEASSKPAEIPAVDRSFANYSSLDGGVSDDVVAGLITSRDQLFGGEALVENLTLRRYRHAQAGETDRVAEIDFDVERGDVLLDRVDLSFVHTGDDGDDKPWEVMRSITITGDSGKLATVSADSADDWSDTGSDYEGSLDGDEMFSIRLSDLDEIIRQGDDADLSVYISMREDVDDAGENVVWGMFVPDRGIRAVDEIGVQHRIGAESSPIQFGIAEADDDDEDPMRVDDDYDNPDSSIIGVPRTGHSRAYNVFTFEVEAGDSRVSIDELHLQLDIKSNPEDDLDGPVMYEDTIHDAALALGGRIYEVESVDQRKRGEDKSSAKLTFDTDSEVSLRRHGSGTIRLLLQVKRVNANYEENVLIRGSVDDGDIRAASGERSERSVVGNWHVLQN